MNELTSKTRSEEIQTIPSYEVAEMMGREHGKVIRMLEGGSGVVGIIPTLNQAKIGVVDYFIENRYVDKKGEHRKCYECTKMGCEMLANKMTGEKGILFTAKYVKRFNDMEKQLHQFTDKQLLQLKILNGDELERILALKEYEQVLTKPLLDTIEENKPKVDVYERFINSDFTYTATALKGIFGFSSAVTMNKKLHELKLIYKPGHSKKWTAYKDTPKSWYKVLATEFGDTLKWTSEGILGIAKLLDIELSEKDIESIINKEDKQ